MAFLPACVEGVVLDELGDGGAAVLLGQVEALRTLLDVVVLHLSRNVVVIVVVWEGHYVPIQELEGRSPQPTPRRSELKKATLSIPPPRENKCNLSFCFTLCVTVYRHVLENQKF